jgi:polyphosphate glucokinase
MSTSGVAALQQILAIDIGATNIKFCHVDVDGELLESVHRKSTPYPCTPDRLVETLSDRISQSHTRYVGVGFPGEFDDGHVIRPGNLSRPGGVATEVDPELEMKWRGFALQDALRAATNCDVRVVNDARMAALGCIDGTGVEVVMTLGTGLGISMAVNGVITKIRDVGAALFFDDQTYDHVLGERARAVDEELWLVNLLRAVEGFADEFHATTVHLAGGNARRVSPDLFASLPLRVVINGNQAPLHGAAKLFHS